MKRIPLIFLALVLLSQTGRAQGLNSDGRDFYVGLLYPSFNAQPITFFGRNVQGFFGVYVLISSYTDNVVTVGYYDDLGNEVNKQTYNVMKRRAVQVPLDIAHMKMTEPGEAAEWKSCHITAKKPINVQYFSTGSCSGGSYLALPTTTLGKQYVVESYHDNEGGVGGGLSNEDASGYFMVIAPFDSTTVEITPSSTTKKKRAGVNCGSGSTGKPQSFFIELNRGQCYMVKGAADGSGCDISGSTVIADKPIAVIAGHENAFTDGSDPTPGGARTLEARDYMVEQMIPVEVWDTTGYVSIPFVDSQAPVNAGEGDEYKVFSGVLPTTSPSGPTKSNIGMNGGTRVFNDLSPWQVPPSGMTNWTSPVSFYSTNGTKIGVAMYDERAQGGGAPYPAPSQMTIIPMSLWKTSYLWYVPNNTFEILQGYYINLICNATDYNKNKILIAMNGGKLTPIGAAGLALKKKYANIPDHPELVGYSMALGPGAYYATTDTGTAHPFMIYNYGFRAIDPDRDLGDFCGDDHFFAYALPVGMGQTGLGGSMLVTVDTGCSSWHVCVHDQRNAAGAGIRSIVIVDDATGDLVRPARQYHNVQFDPSVDPNGTREIDLTGNDSVVCFDVLVSNPLDTAYAPIYVLNNAGDVTLLELHFKGSALSFVSQQGQSHGGDSITFSMIPMPKDTCATVYYYNNRPAGGPSVDITKIALAMPSTSLQISSIVPPTPLTLRPGDSVAVTICFDPKDTSIVRNALGLTTSCLLAKVPIVGQGGQAMIYASDLDLGTTLVGDTNCADVLVTNVGNLPFTLDSGVFRAAGNFRLDPLSKVKLPTYLRPRDSVRMSYCFTPDSEGTFRSVIDWNTNITPLFAKTPKDTSLLRGRGAHPNLEWSGSIVFIFADSNNSSPVGIRRVALSNKGIVPFVVETVTFRGGDSDEFLIVGNQAGYAPFRGFTMDVGEDLWVDVGWNPDITKPYPARYADRHTNLVATYPINRAGTRFDTATMQVVGTFNVQYSDVPLVEPARPGTLKASVTHDKLFVRVPSELGGMCVIELYDLLGHVAARWPNVPLAANEMAELPLPQLSAGAYIVRVSNGGFMRSCKVIVP